METYLLGSTMINAVLFDTGGVLCRPVGNTHRRHWGQRLGLPEGSLEKAVYDSPVACKGFIGQATDTELTQFCSIRFGPCARTIAPG
jgi:hypothetical protein